ncbi:MAG: putative DNA binding domain-containing protein [Armatimonadetes bacterium]|nr:putative DNA binding domain-containing protein [Armatimonadota bacterium]
MGVEGEHGGERKMTREELFQLIAEVHQCQSELENVEVKSAHSGTPRRLYESLSAFSNHVGGGVLLFGLDEERNFDVVGVGSACRLQEDLSSLAASEMEPTLRPEFTVEQVDGRTVVAAEIPELPSTQKPCFYKPAGLQSGSYIRLGNTNRRMTDYEIFGFVSSRQQTTFDQEVVRESTIEDLDQQKLNEYIARLKQARPDASYLNESPERIAAQLRIVRKVEGTLRPTLAGLLVFGKYPQEFEPQLMITFVQYYGVTEVEKTPRGERFLDNRKFEGPVAAIVQGSVDHILASIRKSSLIEGLWRRDIPEYPIEALREAIVNAIAHRDYSPYARGSYVQIRLFADRLEVQSPGGLYGNVTEENLEEEQSTRNRVLMRLMEDLHLVENRGSGIRTMIESMRRANLGPPRFEDKRNSFWVTFRNHSLINPEAIAWLNRFADHPLNDAQRLALVYLRNNKRMTNSDYRRLNHVDSVTSNRELRGLVEAHLVKQHSSRRWAYYSLDVPSEVLTPQPMHSDEEKVLEYVRERGSIGNADCRRLLGIGNTVAWYLLKRMTKRKLLKATGEGRWRRYFLP